MSIEESKRRRRERGQGLVEYALILVMVAVVVIVIGAIFGESVKKTYYQAVWSIDPNIDAPACEAVEVRCNILSSDPFQLEAAVNDNIGDNDIKKVEFYVDGVWHNTEVVVKYCLNTGDGPCRSYTNSGTHTFSAIAYDAEGNTGKCEITATVP